MSLKTVYVLVCMCKMSYFLALTQYIRVEHANSSMTNAFKRCRDEGGHLLSGEGLIKHELSIREQCPEKLNKYYWIGDYSTLTPFMFLAGCFEYKNLSMKTVFIDENSIAKCNARCPNEDGIAIKNNSCQCVTDGNSTLASLKRKPVGFCNIHRNKEILGGSSAMMVYIRERGRFSSDGINPFCYYGKCDGGRGFTFLPCSDMNVAKVVCSHLAADNATTSSWWDAMEECMSNNGSYPLTPEQFRKNVSSLCVKNDDSLTWTNQRQYKDQIVIPEKATGINENFIYSDTIVCQAANMAVGIMFKEMTGCNNNAKENPGYLCYVDAGSSNSSHGTACIVNLSSSHTTKTTESSSTETNVVTSGLDRPRDKASETLPKGVIIGAAAGGSAAILIILVIVFVIRRFRSKGKENRNPPLESRLPKDRESTVYVDTEEGNYDIPHDRRLRLPKTKATEGMYAHANVGGAKESENAYDSTSNLTSSQRDSTYETCTKSSWGEGDPTYDHAIRGGTGQTLHDKNEHDTYDTSKAVTSHFDKTRSGIYDKVGKGSYYKSETSLYDGESTDNGDKGVSDIYAKIEKSKFKTRQEVDTT